MTFQLRASSLTRERPTCRYSAIFIGYSVSNTIVPLLSGPFFSRMGKWRGVTIIAVTITIGVAVVWAGMLANSFPLVVVGRAIYGLGGESVVRSAMVVVGGGGGGGGADAGYCRELSVPLSLHPARRRTRTPSTPILLSTLPRTPFFRPPARSLWASISL